MDFLYPQVVLEPIVLGDLVIEEDELNPQSSTQFLETFRRNQLQTDRGSHEGALVLIRTNGLHRRNFLVPAIIPNLNPPPAIPLPELPSTSTRSSVSAGGSININSEVETELKSNRAEESDNLPEMRPFMIVCECPVPGTQPVSPCAECRKRECFEWSWDKDSNESTAVFQNNDRDVLFNPGFSVGTVAVRGSTPLKQGYHHYWEIEMSSEVYGTDMMIGVSTDKIDLRQHSHSFVSLIGLDEHSWGLSYTGSKQHDGKFQYYTKSFGQHSVIGVHLDLWSGHLEFYINRKPVGKAFSGLQGKVLYPVISSTAARSGMNLIFCRSYQPSLQLHTLLSLGKSMLLPDNVSLFKVLPDSIVPPGLKLWMKNNFWWITSNKEPQKKAEEKKTENKSRVKIFSSEPQSFSGITRRGRKLRKDDTSTSPNTLDADGSQGITTRSMASRKSHLLGTNPIFAPVPSSSSSCSDRPPAKSPRVSNVVIDNDVRRPVTRSSSSPCVRDAHHFELEDSVEETDLPPRAASSASKVAPGRKRIKMCLRSSKR